MIKGMTRLHRHDTSKINAEMHVHLHNRFDIEVVDSSTGKVKQKAQAENVICNALWTRLSTPNSYFNYIHYGTGSGAPSASDTSLFSFLGYGTPTSTDDVVDMKSSLGYISWKRKIQLSETIAVGSTLTEVGIGYSTTASSLVTHAMLKDMNGNQISILKTNTDVINIYATVFASWAIDNYDNGTIIVLSDIYPITLSSPNVSIVKGFWGVLLGMAQSGADIIFPNFMQPSYNGCTASYSPYTCPTVTSSFSATDKKLTITASRLSVSSFNLNGGFFKIVVGASSTNMDIQFPSFLLKVGGSWYPYSTITGESIGSGDGSTKEFATKFSCPYDTTVYINGVAQQSGVSVVYGPTMATDMGKYFEGLDFSSTPDHHIYLSKYALNSNPINQMLGGPLLFYNPFYSIGVTSYTRANGTVLYASDDLENWVEIASTSIPTEYQHYKYWKLYSGYIYGLTPPSSYTGKTIIFDVAPESGAVITADYKTPTVAKDSDHVFDLTLTISLAEQTQ